MDSFFSSSSLVLRHLFPVLSTAAALQTSAGTGSQPDDPLPSGVVVVQIQEVCIKVQAVLTCSKHTVFLFYTRHRAAVSDLHFSISNVLYYCCIH